MKIIKLKKDKKHTLIGKLWLLGAVFLVLLQVIVSNIFVTSGIEVAEIESEIRQLAEENERLHQQVASASSLLTVRQKAKALGFVEADSFLYISPQPFAFDTIE